MAIMADGLAVQELRMRMGSKKIFHIEAFIAKVMT
jgi:hypothetical protein